MRTDTMRETRAGRENTVSSRAEIGVNPNTIMRSYEKLTADGIIYNRRGIGYFICPDAHETVLAAQRKEFLENELPQIRRRMKLLGINPEELKL